MGDDDERIQRLARKENDMLSGSNKIKKKSNELEKEKEIEKEKITIEVTEKPNKVNEVNDTDQLKQKIVSINIVDTSKNNKDAAKSEEINNNMITFNSEVEGSNVYNTNLISEANQNLEESRIQTEANETKEELKEIYENKEINEDKQDNKENSPDFNEPKQIIKEAIKDTIESKEEITQPLLSISHEKENTEAVINTNSHILEEDQITEQDEQINQNNKIINEIINTNPLDQGLVLQCLKEVNINILNDNNKKKTKELNLQINQTDSINLKNQSSFDNLIPINSIQETFILDNKKYLNYKIDNQAPLQLNNRKVMLINDSIHIQFQIIVTKPKPILSMESDNYNINGIPKCLEVNVVINYFFPAIEKVKKVFIETIESDCLDIKPTPKKEHIKNTEIEYYFPALRKRKILIECKSSHSIIQERNENDCKDIKENKDKDKEFPIERLNTENIISENNSSLIMHKNSEQTDKESKKIVGPPEKEIDMQAMNENTVQMGQMVRSPTFNSNKRLDRLDKNDQDSKRDVRIYTYTFIINIYI